MAWEDLPQTALGDDYSLPSWVTVTLQGNLDRTYNMSVCDLHSLGDTSYFSVGFSVTSTWYSLGEGTPDWIGVPIPLRYQRDGSFRKINLECEAKSDGGAGYIRPYLLAARQLDADIVDATDGIIGAEAYDEEEITSSSFTKYSFAIDPLVVETRHYNEVSLPIAWLHWIAKGTATEYIYVKNVRWYEGLDS